MSERENRPAEIRDTRALARHSARQVLNLSVGVAGTFGGLMFAREYRRGRQVCAAQAAASGR